MIKRVDENGNVRLITNIRKPRKWRRFEYIQGVSGCIIDTGQHGHMNFTYEIKFQASNGVANRVWYVQDGDTYYKQVMSLNSGASSGNRFWMTYWSSSNTNSNIGFTNQDSNIHVAKVSNGQWYWDGVSKGRTAQHSDSFITINTINICPNNYNKIYYFKIWDNTDTLLHEYVPAQYNGQYGMWDLVEDKFYGNSGTGTFTVGPEIKNYDEIYEVKKAYSILPSGVELYDYIQSSGTQYIDTGWITNYTKSFEITSKYNASSSGTRGCILSSYNAGRATSLEVTTNSRFWLHDGNIDNSIAASVEVNHVSIFSYGNGTWKHQVDGGTAQTGSTSYSDSAVGSAYMFLDRALRTTTFNKTFKMYYLSIKENGVLIRNFLPCTYLGEPGMWDTVENKFYRNQGTGQFTLGNKITLKEYKYLQSSGTQRIDTGIIPDLTLDTYFKVETLSGAASSSPIIGTRVGSSNPGRYFPIAYAGDSSTQLRTTLGNIDIPFNYTNGIYEGNFLPTQLTSTINGTTRSLSNNGFTKTENNTLQIFGTTGYGTNYYYTKAKVYYVQLKRNNQLVRDFIPVSYNGTPGLWDKVEWKFYANAGSGTFTLGPEKASGIYPVSYLYDRTVYEEPDGSKWLRIAHHNGPNTRRFTSSDSFTTYIHTNEHLFFDVSWCNTFTQWELMVKQKTTSGATEQKFRWIQNYNPMTATFDNTKKANVTHNTSSGYTVPSGNWGGLMKINSDNTYLCGNNGTNGNWWGAIGCKVLYSGGLPGWSSQMVTTGHLDLYIRID